MDVLNNGISFGQFNTFILALMREQSGATWLINTVMEKVKILVFLFVWGFFYLQCITDNPVHPPEPLRILLIVLKHPFWGVFGDIRDFPWKNSIN